jgi:cell division septum initiation protein DivIVA
MLTRDEIIEFIEFIKREFPALLAEHPELRSAILEVTQEVYAGRQQTESRFDRLLEDLRRDREKLIQRWEEQDPKKPSRGSGRGMRKTTVLTDGCWGLVSTSGR